MKKKILTAIAFCMVAICAMSQNYDQIYVNNFDIEKDGITGIQINLDNPENAYCAFQFDLWLPKGITIARNESGALDVSLNNVRKKSNHNLSVERLDNGYYRFVCFSMTNATFNGNSGVIIDLKVESDGSSEEGALKLGSVENIILTKPNGQDVRAGMWIFHINIKSLTGIDQIQGIGGKTEVYDLNGNRIYNVKTLKNGVYIINGRKTLITNKKSQKQ